MTVHLFFFQLARGRLAVMTGAPERGVVDLLELGRRTQLVPFDNPADFPWRRYAVEGLMLLARAGEALRWPATNSRSRGGGERPGARGDRRAAAQGARRRDLLVDGERAPRGGAGRTGADEQGDREALFVTVKTVEVNLSNVYRKLAIGPAPTRSDARHGRLTAPSGAAARTPRDRPPKTGVASGGSPNASPASPAACSAGHRLAEQSQLR